jgi:hypothetical protein
MGFNTFFGLLGKKAEKIGSDMEAGLIALIAKTDFETLEAYQIEEYEKILDKVSLQMASAKAGYDREKKEFDDLSAQFKEKLADANLAKEKMNAGATPTDLRDKLQAHLLKLVPEIESMKIRLVSEEQEYKQAEEDYTVYREVVTSAAQRLAAAKKNLGDKKRELKSLTAQEERNKQREAQQKELMGIKERVDNMGTILGSLDKEINDKKIKVEASAVRVDALKKAGGSVSEIDPDVAAILGKTTSGAPEKSVFERLDALNQ